MKKFLMLVLVFAIAFVASSCSSNSDSGGSGGGGTSIKLLSVVVGNNINDNAGLLNGDYDIVITPTKNGSLDSDSSLVISVSNSKSGDLIKVGGVINSPSVEMSLSDIANTGNGTLKLSVSATNGTIKLTVSGSGYPTVERVFISFPS